MAKILKERPNDGGRYRRTAKGYERLDKPQAKDPGKTARSQAPAKGQQRAGNTTAPAAAGDKKE